MNAALLIYLAEASGSICVIATVAFIFSAIAIMIAGFCFLTACDHHDEKKVRTLIKLSLIVFGCSGFIGTVFPSKQTIYLMAGAQVAQNIITSPETKEISVKIMTILNQKLDEMEKKK